MMDEMKETILRVVQQLDPEKGFDGQIWDVPFLDLRITSIDFVRLIVEIEKACDVEVPDEELDIEKLPSLEAVGQYILKLKQAGPA